MPISPEHLPPEWHYVIPLAERHGTDARVALYDRGLGWHVEYAEKLTEDDLGPLRELYLEMRANGHGPAIVEWHGGHSGRRTCPAETTWPVYGLLCLFAQLRRLGVRPFDDGAVGPEGPARAVELDWGKLPPPLRYLAGTAEVYGGLQFEGRIREFLRHRVTPAELDELRALAQLYNRDGEAIDRWLDEFRITDHPEASLIYFTGNLLGTADDLGLL